MTYYKLVAGSPKAAASCPFLDFESGRFMRQSKYTAPRVFWHVAKEAQGFGTKHNVCDTISRILPAIAEVWPVHGFRSLQALPTLGSCTNDKGCNKGTMLISKVTEHDELAYNMIPRLQDAEKIQETFVSAQRGSTWSPI